MYIHVYMCVYSVLVHVCVCIYIYSKVIKGVGSSPTCSDKFVFAQKMTINHNAQLMFM